VPSQVRNAVALTLVIAGGYVAGSVASRLSSNLLDDELLGSLPTEDNIRDSIYQARYCKPDCDPAKKERCSPSILLMNEGVPVKKDPDLAHFLEKVDPDAMTELKDVLAARSMAEDLQRADVLRRRNMLWGYFCPAKTVSSPLKPEERIAEENRRDHLKAMFLLQEGQVLLYGQDKVDRLKQYYDQSIVLRGATFNGFILGTLSLFCCCGILREHLSKHGDWKFLAYIPAFALTVIALSALCHHLTTFWAPWHHLAGHWKDPDLDAMTEPPLVEVLLLLLGMTGIWLTSRIKTTPSTANPIHGRTAITGHWLTSRANRTPPRGNPSYVRTLIVATVITLACYGGWWWTEYLYDTQVIYTLPELHEAQKPSDIQIGGDETPPPVKTETQGTKSPPTPSPAPASRAAGH
jgi:hypothetical protein